MLLSLELKINLMQKISLYSQALTSILLRQVLEQLLLLVITAGIVLDWLARLNYWSHNKLQDQISLNQIAVPVEVCQR